MSRKLATVTKIKEIIPIEGADRIVAITMTTNNWVCVVSKSDVVGGDLGVYFEIDSFLPKEERYAFLDGRSNKTMNDVEGYRLRTIKLRKQISQGLFIPISAFLELTNVRIGDDVTELLGIKLYEPPDVQVRKRLVSGNCPMRSFPPFVRKTDQERIQSFDAVRLQLLNNKKYEITEKLDGTSVTFYYGAGRFGVCSRNYEVATTFDKTLFQRFVHWVKKTLKTFWGDYFKKRYGFSHSVYEDMAIKYNLRETLPALCKEYGVNYAIQGEIVGTHISVNRLGLNTTDFYVFDVFDINAQKYVDAYKRYDIVCQLGLSHVPILDKTYTLNLEETPIEKLVEVANGKSVLSDNLREGLVYKARGDSSEMSFKVISNEYLLKHGL